MAMLKIIPTIIPGPPPAPLIGWPGNILQFGRDTLGYLWSAYKQYGDLAAFVRGGNPYPLFVFAFGPTYNRQLLSDTDLFYSAVSAITPRRLDGTAAQRLGSGLTAMSGERHRQQRRLMQPAFHRQYVEGYRDDIVALTYAMLDRWQPQQRLDMFHAMTQLTLQIATKTLFGLDARQDTQNAGVLLKRWQDLALGPGVSLFPVNLPGTPYHRMLRMAEHIEAQLRHMIAEKRATGDAQRDVLSMLLAARDDDGTALTDDELIGQAVVLFVAGHETSANALTWTLFLLAQHPSVLMDLQDELGAVCHGDAPSTEQLGRLPLLDRVVKESLRLLPPLCFNLRQSTAPFGLGPYELPAGTVILFSEYITHHMAELYAEPQRFVPERWATITPSPYEYLPFSAGARMCIGAAFATLEIKLVLATLLGRFRVTTIANSAVNRHLRVTLAPKGGLPMQVLAPDAPLVPPAVRGDIHELVDLAERA